MIDTAVLHVFRTAKAYAALIGSLLLLVSTTVGADTLPSWFPTVLALLTAFSVWAVPNTDPMPAEQPIGQGGQD
jgi:hypothetical protein